MIEAHDLRGVTVQERKRHINLRKIPGTPAGCPWDTRRDKQGSTGRCPRDFLLFTIEKGTEKGIFAGTPAVCPRNTGHPGRFQNILCDFFLCAFSAPSLCFRNEKSAQRGSFGPDIPADEQPQSCGTFGVLQESSAERFI